MSIEKIQVQIKSSEMNGEQRLKTQGTPEDFITNCPENSVRVILAQILIDKGLEELRIDQPLGSAGKGAKGIFGTKRAREIMERIVHTPEFHVIFIAHDISDIPLAPKDFVNLKIKEFKSTKLIEEFQILQLKKHVEKLEDLFPYSSDNAQMNRFTREEEKKLNEFIASGVHILTDEEIKAIIEVIVDANARPEDLIDERIRHRTLSANEVADLDPYGVRK